MGAAFRLLQHTFSTIPWGQWASANGAGTPIYDPGLNVVGGNIVIPASWNGRLIRPSAAARGGSGISSLAGLKNSSAYDGRCRVYWTDAIGAAQDGSTAIGAPTLAATGDVYSWTGADSYKAIELLATGVKAAVVNLSSDFAGASVAAVQWNNEVLDNAGWHDNTTNPSRFTVPSGVSLVRVSCSVFFSAAPTGTPEALIEFYKNGSLVYPGTEAQFGSFASPPIPVVPGDYIEVAINAATGWTMGTHTDSWYAIEELPSTLKWAIFQTTVDIDISATSSFVNGAPIVDVGGWYAGSFQFTVPSGVNIVRTGLTGKKTSNSGTFYMQQQHVGGQVGAYSSSQTLAFDYASALTMPVVVTPGDTFSCSAYANSGATKLLAGAVYWIEEVPAIT